MNFNEYFWIRAERDFLTACETAGVDGYAFIERELSGLEQFFRRGRNQPKDPYGNPPVYGQSDDEDNPPVYGQDTPDTNNAPTANKSKQKMVTVPGTEPESRNTVGARQAREIGQVMAPLAKNMVLTAYKQFSQNHPQHDQQAVRDYFNKLSIHLTKTIPQLVQNWATWKGK